MLDLPAMDWRKSNHSSGQGGNCVEVAQARWRTSSTSGQGGADRVEVAGLPGIIAIRDSKDPYGPVLAFDNATFGRFVATIRTGSHER
ncbi:DUF397 domain-containing protein [Actinomadura scrupuli]|uniref:DUF397 domain-containing protein n=1 Tax=Actinomadura scrupuli TaxID=559629 RepID=UPI003D99AE98